jgi:hypothetical protein
MFVSVKKHSQSPDGVSVWSHDHHSHHGSTGKSGGRVAHRLRELGYSVWAVTRLLGGATKP